MGNKYPFNLRFNEQCIQKRASLYPAEYDAELETKLALEIRLRGYLLKPEFEIICRWKTPRSKKRIASNPADYVEAVTETALSTPSVRLRIEILLLPRSIRWPTGSVILHFGHHDRYPILDYRALWSLGIDANSVPYNFEFWYEYTQFCRKLAKEAGVSMRELDRALWQFSKANQE